MPDMTHFQSAPGGIMDETRVDSLSADDIVVWLDEWLIALNSRADPSLHAEQSYRRLKEIAFEAILSAIDRQRSVGDAAAISLYRHWIAANDSSTPLLFAAWFNLGVLLARAGETSEAAVAYGNALTLRSDLYGAAVNLGLLFEANGHPEQAIATWRRATQPDEARIALGIQQGRLLEKLGRLEEAERALYQVLLADSAQPDVIHHWIHIRQKMCLWPVVPSDFPGIAAPDLLRTAGPLSILALTDDIHLQRDAAATWVARKTQPQPRLAPPRPYSHQRIRIGYLSSDFCSHAMSYLITELFERHDRDHFEVFGYCSSREDGSEIRQRVLAAFDQHRLIRELPDEQAARLIRDDEIDILVDLNGITDGSRLPVMRWKPAPIQATYLGFIGPVPLPELDYLLCDTIVIPPEHQSAYQPVPLAIAPLYQANDTRRTVGRRICRADVGLPDDHFVFCCFSRHYKITETMFSAWLAILRRSRQSVLWFAEDNAYSRANLLAAAQRDGIDARRLIFSERVDPDLYLSRLGLADLFLDTFPYNAGTVASDAIRMGLPVVTLCGQAFASRMATSLLHAVGAPQGITTSLSNYIETSIRMANDPSEHARFKALISSRSWSRSLGDMARFTSEYEATWRGVVNAHLR
jgi:predicted O-linked N-acetylglucosamine transferase (SPINDLY family)